MTIFKMFLRNTFKMYLRIFQDVPLNYTSRCSYELHFKMYLRIIFQDVPLNCTSRCTYELHFKVYLRIIFQDVPLNHTSRCSYELNFKMYLHFKFQDVLMIHISKCSYEHIQVYCSEIYGVYGNLLMVSAYHGPHLRR